MSGAFEAAVIQGRSLGDVLQSIAQDLLSLTIRRTVTSPLEQAITAFDFGSLFGGGAAVGLVAGAAPSPTNISPVDFAPVASTRSRALSRAVRPGASAALQQVAVTAPAPAVSVEVNNRGTPQQVESPRTRFDGERLVVEMVTADIARRGPMAAAFENAYGVRRSR